jgi:hypothetical protein
MFEILQASWVVAVDSPLKKFPLKELRWCKVQGSLWPKATPDNAVTEEGLQESCCCFHGMDSYATLLKPAVLFILFW